MFDTLLALRIAEGDIQEISLRDGSTATAVHDAGPWPDGIVVADGTAYWTTMGPPSQRPGVAGEDGADFRTPSGGLHAASLSGGRPRDVVVSGSITTGKQLAYDGAGRLYWADREGCRISSVRLDGTDRQDLVVNTPDDSGEQECVGVAVDAETGHLYWSQKGPAKGGKGRIFRAGLALPAGEAPGARSDVELLWEGLPEPIDLEVHDGSLYWTDRGAAPDGNTLNRAPLPAPGACGEAPEILARGFHEAIGLAIDGDAGLAFVSDLSGRIVSVELDSQGVAEPRLVAKLQTPVTGLAGVGRTQNVRK